MTTVKSQRRFEYLFFGLLLILCLFLANIMNFPDNKPVRPYKISSDKAQYYIYLPATFIYNWDAHKFPKNCDKDRYGFVLDSANNKVSTKTTYGVALLWSPFFLATHLIALQWSSEPDGFSYFYERMTIVPGVIYLILGLFFLRRFLLRYYSSVISYLTVIIVFVGTNLYSYAMKDGLMSHVNSFFLFCLYLFLLKKFLDSERKPFPLFIGISLVVAVAMLIRPTNIILLTWMAFLDARSMKEIWQRIVFFLKPKYIIAFVVIAFLIFLPQLFYWKYLTGKFVYYSYPGESFTNFANPMLLPFWFAPLNGLFLYSPLVLLFIAGMVIMIVKKVPNGIFTLGMFLLISYIFASWYCWFFGGSFGCRPMVEFYALFALPFGYLLTLVSRNKNLYIRSLTIVFIIASSYYTLKLTYLNFWNTASTWAWNDYLLRLDQCHLYHDQGRSFTYVDDFENPAQVKVYPTNERYHSATVGAYVNDWAENYCAFSRILKTILPRPTRKVTASIWVYRPEKIKTGTQFACLICDGNYNLMYSRTLPLDNLIRKPGEWTKISETIKIPWWIDQSNSISFVVKNPGRKYTLFFDDLYLKFE